MDANQRHDRLLADLESLNRLKEDSTIFDFEATGDPPDRYTLIFRGKGVCQDTSARGDVKLLELHRCDLRMPYSYPGRAPDIRWLTPIFHPNISFSGFIHLRDVGLPWEKALTLDVVCERLWDVARLAFLDLEQATNYSAKNWFENENTLQLPVDARTLRDRVRSPSRNVVRYRRRGDDSLRERQMEELEGEVLYIGEDTPPPPPSQTSPRRPPPDDDTLYIGF